MPEFSEPPLIIFLVSANVEAAKFLNYAVLHMLKDFDCKEPVLPVNIKDLVYNKCFYPKIGNTSFLSQIYLKIYRELDFKSL